MIPTAPGHPLRPFLTARWEGLVLLNYVSPEEALRPLVPRGTELDAWQGETLVSLVGFMFRDTRVRGIAVPFHRTFEEVNLRFYVSRCMDGEPRRGVVFVRELVPRRAIAAVARRVYGEPYLAVPMEHSVVLDPETGGSASYGWRLGDGCYRLGAEASGPARTPEAGSEAEFITEHYWGYTRERDGRTLEYRVDHPAWQVWSADRAWFEGPAADLYGASLGEVFGSGTRSAFVALGSQVAVHEGRRLVTPEAESAADEP